MQRN